MLKHEKDIRRRLAIAEVPKPPADLVHKIKHDIPKHFTSMTAKQVEKKPREASPLWNFWGFSWQLAASILVLVGLTWAVFEAYQSEVNEATRVADAAGGVTSVEEFEAQIAEPPGTVRVEGTAPVPAAQPAGEMKKDQAPPPPPKEATTTSRPSAFAPEPELAGRAREEAPLEDRADDERAKRENESSQAGIATAQASAAETSGKDFAAAEQDAVPAPPAPARAAAAPAAPAASTEALGAVGQKTRAAAKEVTVKGLSEERIVRVDLRLDDSGKVITAVVVGVRDKAILDAVAAAAPKWTFAPEKDAGGRTVLARTIDVQLRKGN